MTMSVQSSGTAVEPEDLAETVYSRLLGCGDAWAFDRFRKALDALVADGEANDGIAASVASGDGLWVAVPGDGGDVISSGLRGRLLSTRSSHV